MMGVNGWCSANQRSPAGIESVGTKPLLRNGRSIRNIGVLLAVSTLFGGQAHADRQPGEREREEPSSADRAEPAERAGVGAEPEQEHEGRRRSPRRPRS